MMKVAGVIVAIGVVGAALLESGPAGAFGDPTYQYLSASTQTGYWVPNCAGPNNTSNCVVSFSSYLGAGGGWLAVTADANNTPYIDGVGIQCRDTGNHGTGWVGPYDGTAGGQQVLCNLNDPRDATVGSAVYAVYY